MSKDLSRILEGWQYEPEKLTVRIVKGYNGKEKVQLRVELGVLQMELDGRPDGQSPEGCQSYLEFYERQQRAHDAAHPDSALYLLGEEDCARLWREAVQYYHRYLSFWHLKLYDLCAVTPSGTCDCLPLSARTPTTTATSCNSTSGGPT